MSEPLLNSESIKKVLDGEVGEGYQAYLSWVARNEPALFTNLQHWIKRETERMLKMFPDMSEPMLTRMGEVLECYFVRGLMMQREAYGLELDRALDLPYGDDL